MLSTNSFISIILTLRVLMGSAAISPMAGHYAAINATPAEPNASSQTESPRTAFDFVNSIGLNTHLNYFDRIYGNFPFVKRELQSLGVRHLRDGVHLQNSDYNQALYGRWIQLGTIGVRFDAVLDPRSKLGPLSGTVLDQIGSLAGHTIESFEGANELDVSNQPNWSSIARTYQNELFTAVKSMKDHNSITIIGPSLASASNSSQVRDLSALMNEGNLHPYPAGQMPSVVFPGQINLETVVCDGKPIVFTETGYHNAVNEQHDQPGVSEAAAAKYIPRLFLEDFMRGIPRTYLYEFMDEASEPGLKDPQMHWGLIRSDGSEKPAFSSLKNLIDELNDSSEPTSTQALKWRINSPDAHIHHLLLQKSNGTDDIVLWQEISSYDVRRHTDLDNPKVSTTLSFGRKARIVTIYQPATQAGPLHIWKNVTSVPLQIPDQPLVVEIAF
jgi:hypothetical protein